jgi:AcrR family transcriptional regulator
MVQFVSWFPEHTVQLTPPPKTPAGGAEDHRTRTGAQRREQTRRRLIASALAVFAEKGPDAPVIDDFIAAAGVSRGTFYNHFSTTHELLDAATSELTDAVLERIDAAALRLSDPLERMACGCLCYAAAAIALPAWGAFVLRTGLRQGATGKLVDVYLPRDLEAARSAGQLVFDSTRAARDLTLGALHQAVAAVAEGAAGVDHPREVMALVLHGLGVAQAKARRLCSMELPALDLPHDWLRAMAAGGAD